MAAPRDTARPDGGRELCDMPRHGATLGTLRSVTSASRDRTGRLLSDSASVSPNHRDGRGGGGTVIAGAAGREAWGDREPALRGGESSVADKVWTAPDAARPHTRTRRRWRTVLRALPRRWWGAGRGGAGLSEGAWLRGTEGPARLLPVPPAVTRAGRGVVGQPGSTFGGGAAARAREGRSGVLRSGTTAGCRLRARKGRPRRHTGKPEACAPLPCGQAGQILSSSLYKREPPPAPRWPPVGLAPCRSEAWLLRPLVGP